MTDCDDGGITSASKPDSPIPEMTLWQKIEFIGWPLVWAVLSIVWFILGSLVLTLCAVLFVLLLKHRVKAIDPRDPLAGLAILALSSVGLWITGAKLLRAVRRKRRTGSLFPRGEELISWKARRQRRPLWKRIFAVALIAWLAMGPTVEVFRTAYQHSPSMWAIATLMWMAAILFSIAAFPVRPEPRWLSPSLAAVFGLTAVIAAHLATSSQDPRGFWVYSALMLALSAGCWVELFRSNRRRPQLPSQSVG
jgi:predicted membrane channel-forming protein YqfA (hemolysin III family)